MVNWVGQTMPVAKIADMAHAHNIEVIADGAHCFGLLDFKIPDLHCDYFGTSLHKFLSAPIGTGMMWIREDKIEKVWPLTCNGKPHSSDIRKFETWVRAVFRGAGHRRSDQFPRRHRLQAQGAAHLLLKNYWATRVQPIPKVKLHTSLNARYSCAICGVSIDGMTPARWRALFDKYKIHTVGIVWENISCVRVTPHVYTTIVIWTSWFAPFTLAA